MMLMFKMLMKMMVRMLMMMLMLLTLVISMISMMLMMSTMLLLLMNLMMFKSSSDLFVWAVQPLATPASTPNILKYQSEAASFLNIGAITFTNIMQLKQIL